MSNVIEQIEQQIAKLSTKVARKNTGIIRTIADGVAKIEGLSDVMYNEMVSFPGGVIGIALNLEEDEVGCVILGDVSQLKQGDEVVFRVEGNRAVLARTADFLSLAGSISVPAAKRNVAWDEVIRKTRSARAARLG